VKSADRHCGSVAGPERAPLAVDHNVEPPSQDLVTGARLSVRPV
jgi:hypothetical protein